MSRWASFLIFLITGCGFPRPADVVSCTLGEFAECRGDTELTCNSAGNDYDAIQCARGCDPAVGCRLCDANQTVCTNGKVQRCDATGAITSAEDCQLGCFEDQPRCREIDPSNGLGSYVDRVPNPPDLDLPNAFFATDTGIVFSEGKTIPVPNFLVDRSGNGVPIRAFIANSVHLSGTTIVTATSNTNVPQPGFALITRGDILITGAFVVSQYTGTATLGCRPAGPGAWASTFTAGGGGGANGTDGADGGSVINNTPGGVRDLASGTTQLVPLRGGCSGGVAQGVFLNGGGAAQLSSGTRIDIDATLDARGADGTYGYDQDWATYAVGGGGGGGSLLLESPQVALGANAKLLTSGGNGYTVCPLPNCGAAGTGATATAAATKGMDVPSVLDAMAGGGGGGLGRVRINTKTGVYTKTNSTVEDAVLTTGILSTR